MRLEAFDADWEVWLLAATAGELAWFERDCPGLAIAGKTNMAFSNGKPGQQ